MSHQGHVKAKHNHTSDSSIRPGLHCRSWWWTKCWAEWRSRFTCSISRCFRSTEKTATRRSMACTMAWIAATGAFRGFPIPGMCCSMLPSSVEKIFACFISIHEERNSWFDNFIVGVFVFLFCLFSYLFIYIYMELAGEIRSGGGDSYSIVQLSS